MAGTQVEIGVNELKALSERLNNAKLSPAEADRLLRSLATEVETQSQDRFDTKTDPEGNDWKAIAESTRKYLERYFPAAQPPLVRTGEYRDSVESQIMGGMKILVGSAKEYSGFLQDGTRNMEARKVFGIGAADIADLTRLTRDFLEALL
jgi:phage gpG-like protein